MNFARNEFIEGKGVQLKFIFILLFSQIAFAQVIPDGFESYLGRPDILTATPISHPNIRPDWSQFKWAHLEAVAQLVEMYPQHDIYFLARDAEQLYDFAKLALQNEPRNQERIHLLNVSRVNKKSPNLKDYLRQEGLSEETLLAGKKVLLVDVGIYGTIFDHISNLFSSKAQKQIQGHMMGSQNPKIPGTRVFLHHFAPTEPLIEPSSGRGIVFSLEDLTRATDRSSDYVQVKGVWHPISKIDQETDGRVHKPVAIQIQQDMAYFWNQGEVQATFAHRRQVYRYLADLFIMNENSGLFQRRVIQFLNFRKKDSSEWFRPALISDILDIFRLNFGYDKQEFVEVEQALKKIENEVIASVRRKASLEARQKVQHPPSALGQIRCEKVFSL